MCTSTIAPNAQSPPHKLSTAAIGPCTIKTKPAFSSVRTSPEKAPIETMLYITTGGGPGTDTTNLPLYLYTTVKANNYGYANTIGVVIILLGFVTMTLIRKIFGMNKED